MKISKIAKLCKDTKCVQYAVEEKGMWLGNGDCAYLIPEFTYLDRDGIALALGISEKDKGKFLFINTTTQLKELNLADCDETETVCEKIDFIVFRSKSIPFKTEVGIRFLSVGMLDVLKDEIENLEIYMRRDKTGKEYFVAKVGMYIYAVFTPERIINADFINKLNEFNNICRATYQNDEANAQAYAPSADETQMQLEGAKE